MERSRPRLRIRADTVEPWAPFHLCHPEEFVTLLNLSGVMDIYTCHLVYNNDGEVKGKRGRMRLRF
jgi:hypothetical protein